ncbi:MAG: hypothetical protein IJF67_16065 [Clostridia bacterium]|nr:hypothetical protein [Clostridia bacterium]
MQRFLLFLIIPILLIGCADKPMAPVLSATLSPASAAQADMPSDSAELPAVETVLPSTDDIPAYIEEHLAILLSDSSSIRTEKEIIAVNPAAFDAIVALGEKALPYLAEVRKNAPLTYNADIADVERHIVTMAAEYAIEPDLYNKYYPSPDGKRSVKLHIENVSSILSPEIGLLYGASVIDHASGDVLVATENAWYSSTVSWSDDSRYAVIYEDGFRYFTLPTVLDIERGKVIPLPYEHLNALAMEHDSIENFSGFYGTHLHITDWPTADTMKVEFTCVLSAVYIEGRPHGYTGFYIYDLAAEKIISLEYEALPD